MTGWQLLVSVLLGLAINECSDVSPWCARRLVHWSAHRRFTDSARADARAEELTALIDDRPGKLFKLFTALGFAAEAVIFLARRAASRQIATSRAQRADAALDSGTDAQGGLLAGIMKDPAQARWCRLLVGASIASFVLQIMVGLVPFTFLFFCLSIGSASSNLPIAVCPVPNLFARSSTLSASSSLDSVPAAPTSPLLGCVPKRSARALRLAISSSTAEAGRLRA